MAVESVLFVRAWRLYRGSRACPLRCAEDRAYRCIKSTSVLPPRSCLYIGAVYPLALALLCCSDLALCVDLPKALGELS